MNKEEALSKIKHWHNVYETSDYCSAGAKELAEKELKEVVEWLEDNLKPQGVTVAEFDLPNYKTKEKS
jgi:hypothetical protein